MCYVLPENISFDEAALLDLTGVAVHAVRLGVLHPNIKVAVLGCGPIGSTIGQIAKAWGAVRIFCVDKYDKALEIAAKSGIDDVIDADREDVVRYIKKRTGDLGVDAVFDTVCSVETQRQAMEILAAQGILVNLATNVTQISFNLLELGSEKMIRSSSNYLIQEFQMAIDLVASGKISVKPMITHHLSVDETEKGFLMLMQKEKHGAFKIIIIP
jgi:threonine dehydrogenase-like Zn-dependent dehydrogenase